LYNELLKVVAVKAISIDYSNTAAFDNRIKRNNLGKVDNLIA
jgi:hypothetical protein